MGRDRIATVRILACDDDAGTEWEIDLPAHWVVCSACQGSGVTVAHVECDGGGFTSSEWAEQDDDFREGYMSGRYDRPCPTCKGERVVAKADPRRMTPEQKKHWNVWRESLIENDRAWQSEARLRAMGG
jgi:DnaJ-class molecular chaperone